MNTRFLVASALAVVFIGCESTTDLPRDISGTADAEARTHVTTVPDPLTNPEGLVDALGEKVVVCKEGPTGAKFLVDDGITISELEVGAGKCRIGFSKAGSSTAVTVRELVPPHQAIQSIVRTQLTCGLGLGIQCDPDTSPVIETFSAESNPVTGTVGGSGSASNRSVYGLSGFVVKFTNAFAPDGVAPQGEQVIVCLRGVGRATFFVDDGARTREVQLGRGCSRVYGSAGATRSVTVRQRPPSGFSVAQVFLTQLTCGRGLGVQCDPATSPVVVGPSAASNPVTGLVGGSGGPSNPSQFGLSGYVAEFFNVRN